MKQRKIREEHMIQNLPGIAALLEKTNRRQRIEDDYEDFERRCRTEAVAERRNAMGEEIYEDSRGEGSRSLLWIWEDEVQREVQDRVTAKRIEDALAEDQGDK